MATAQPAPSMSGAQFGKAVAGFAAIVALLAVTREFMIFTNQPMTDVFNRVGIEDTYDRDLLTKAARSERCDLLAERLIPICQQLRAAQLQPKY